MRLLCVTSSYPRTATDLAGCFVRDLLGELREVGVTAEVLVPDGAGADEAHPVARALTSEPARRVHRVRYAWPRSAQRLFFGSGAPENLEREVWRHAQAPLAVGALATAVAARAGAVDLVLAHWMVPSGLAAVLGAAMTGTPVAVVAHSGDVHLLARLPGGAALARFIAARARAVFAVCDETARILRGLGVSENVRVLRLGARRTSPLESRRALRARLGVAPAGRLVLGLGRLEPVKGFDVLVRALAQMEQPAQLVLAGGGREHDALSSLAHALRIPHKMLGVVDAPRKWALLRAADVVVFPSRRVLGGRTEGVPVALLETLAAGRPFVATEVGGVPEVAAFAPRGCLVPPDEPLALARAIERALSRRAQYGRASVRAGRALGIADAGPRWRDALAACIGSRAAPTRRAA